LVDLGALEKAISIASSSIFQVYLKSFLCFAIREKYSRASSGVEVPKPL